MIKGITVTLHVKAQSGTDGFNRPITTTEDVEVDNVLVGEPSSEDIIGELNLSGKKLAYTLAIPKGDENTWAGNTVDFFGETFRVIGEPTQGIEANIPLAWNKKVKVERIE
jgi:hypothetical protein